MIVRESMARRTWRPKASVVGLLGTVLLLGTPADPASAGGWKAGTARVAITPEGPIWMAGYASRTRPSEGVLHDLWAKALVLEDPEGERAVLVTMDLCGFSRPLADEIRDDIEARHNLDRAHVVLSCSHTHSGPVVRENLATMYSLDAEQARKVEAYARSLHRSVVDVVGRAIGTLAPAELAWETGRADFAVNRRENVEKDVPALRDRLALRGPTDPDVPVLRVADAQGRVLSIVCGYACHCTTTSDYQIHGDYAGFAQIDLEKDHPGAQAMFVAGCGADQNPIPRRKIELAEVYGRQLADAVDRVLAGPMRPVDGPLSVAYEEINLAFGPLPPREQWEAEAKGSNKNLANRARAYLKRLDAGETLPTSYPYPVQVWKLGGGPTWFFLGGEVVVDYGLRIKRNLGATGTWVSAYCNDVMAYIPSARVLKEGGYEGATSMIVYGQPTDWGDRIEEDIIDAAARVERQLRSPH